MNLENEDDDIRKQLENAFEQEENPVDPADAEDSVEPEESPKAEEASVEGEGQEAPVEVKKFDPPNSLRKEIKDKWSTLPPDIQEEWVKREEDIERMMTHPSGELALGKQMKEVITPYLPLINAANLQPSDAVKNLLNAEYVLRTGDQATKVNFAKQLLRDYGIDAGLLVEQKNEEYQDPVISQLLEKISKLEQQTNPDNIKSILHKQQEYDTISQEWRAFSENPAHIYLKDVKQDMQALLESGRAANYQEAYDKACWLNPVIRQNLLQSQDKQKEEKKKQEVIQKKAAASSISGSPATPSGNSQGKSEKNLRDELLAAFDAQESNLI